MSLPAEVDRRPGDRSVRIGGFRIRDTTSRALARFLANRVRTRRRTAVFFANANFIVRCRHLADATNSDAGIIVVNDGIAMAAAARLSRFRFCENLNGTDFVPYFLANSRRPLRVYLFGSAPEVVAKAGRMFAGFAETEIVGVQDGYADMPLATLLETINLTSPDVVLVALGNPLQEEWIFANRAGLSAPVLFGVGALFDFTAGTAKRAPLLVRRLRLEWAYRLYREPRRLLKRYTIDMVRFLMLVVATDPRRRDET